MANFELGEVKFAHAGQQYTLIFDFNAMVEYEDATGENAMVALKSYEDGSLSARQSRALFWAMLQDRHPEVDLKQAGKMVMSASDALGRALKAAAPEPDKDAPSGNVRRRVSKARR